MNFKDNLRSKKLQCILFYLNNQLYRQVWTDISLEIIFRIKFWKCKESSKWKSATKVFCCFFRKIFRKLKKHVKKSVFERIYEFLNRFSKFWTDLRFLKWNFSSREVLKVKKFGKKGNVKHKTETEVTPFVLDRRSGSDSRVLDTRRSNLRVFDSRGGGQICEIGIRFESFLKIGFEPYSFCQRGSPFCHLLATFLNF